MADPCKGIKREWPVEQIYVKEEPSDASYDSEIEPIEAPSEKDDPNSPSQNQSCSESCLSDGADFKIKEETVGESEDFMSKEINICHFNFGADASSSGSITRVGFNEFSYLSSLENHSSDTLLESCVDMKRHWLLGDVSIKEEPRDTLDKHKPSFPNKKTEFIEGLSNWSNADSTSENHYILSDAVKHRIEPGTTSNKKGKVLSCQYCEKKWYTKKDLRRHLLTHTGEKPHECHLCRRRFGQKGHLNAHINSHEGNRPFECKHCDTKFTLKKNLLKHLFAHTGEKPYKCHLCDKNWTRKGDLQRHLIMHTGVKPFQCPQCARMFSQKGHLDSHLTVHTGEKPHKCQSCSKEFRLKKCLKRHLILEKHDGLEDNLDHN